MAPVVPARRPASRSLAPRPARDDRPRAARPLGRAARAGALGSAGVVLALALPAGASAATCSGATRTVASQGPTKAERAVRCLVNQRRAAGGLKALGHDGRAARAARRHTDDMVRRRYFDHVSPGGGTISDRVNATGMKWRTIGENIAVGQRTPAAVVSGWMRSPGHRANIMNAAFTVLGVGVSRRGTGGYSGPTWTQVFARPR